MKKTFKKIVSIAMALTMMLTVAGCGSGTAPAEVVAEVVPDAPEVEVTEIETVDLDEAAENETTEEPEEEVEEEPEEVLTYVEENGLEYTTEWGFETTGYALNAMDHADHVDVPVWFELSDISVEDAEEEGFKTVTVKQAITGYRWFDGREKKTDVLFPSLAVADSYTGLIIPGKTTHYDEVLEESGTDIEWEGETYHISYVEEAEWDYENEWKPLSDGNFAGWCTVYDTLIITIPENYDGLALLLPPISTVKESVAPDEHIMDYWGEDGKDSYLFNALEMAKEGEEDAESVTPATTDAKSNKTETAKPSSTATTAPKQEETKTQEQKTASKPAHTHSYTSSVTANPTCANAGTKTFTCSCGDSYTESIPASGHQWETRTETIHHESQGHMESTPVEKNSFECGGCHSMFDSLDGLESHLMNSGCMDSNWLVVTETTYDNTWVVDSEAWDETVTVSTCSVCGATQ